MKTTKSQGFIIDDFFAYSDVMTHVIGYLKKVMIGHEHFLKRHSYVDVYAKQAAGYEQHLTDNNIKSTWLLADRYRFWVI